jgi:hypothetical protein
MTFPNVDPFGLTALVGGAAYMSGQFLSSRRRGKSDSLAFALESVAAHKLKIENMVSELSTLHVEVAALRKENEILRTVIATRNDLDDKLIGAITVALDKQTDRLSLLFQGALIKRSEG